MRGLLMARRGIYDLWGKKIPTADLADSTTAVFHLLSAALTQGKHVTAG